MALCEIVASPELKKKSATIWVHENHDHVVTRLLFVYTQPPSCYNLSGVQVLNAVTTTSEQFNQELHSVINSQEEEIDNPVATDVALRITDPAHLSLDQRMQQLKDVLLSRYCNCDVTTDGDVHPPHGRSHNAPHDGEGQAVAVADLQPHEIRAILGANVPLINSMRYRNSTTTVADFIVNTYTNGLAMVQASPELKVYTRTALQYIFRAVNKPSFPAGERQRQLRALASQSQIPPLFGAKSGFEMCFGPSTSGAGAKTRLESRIKNFNPHCICRLRRTKGARPNKHV